jgi:hypothetical protein
MIRAFAIEAGGPVLEVGAYMGGATVAAAHGLQVAGRGRVISVDRGGAYPTHPHLPSQDIHADWRRTIADFGAVGTAILIEGFTFRAETRERIRAALNGEPIRLVIIDADGYVFAHLGELAACLAPDCLFVIDDYGDPAEGPDGDGTVPSNRKFARTRHLVDNAVRRGALERYAVLPWSTWFGRLGPHFPALAADLVAEEIADRTAFLMARDGNLDNRNPPGGFQPLH